MRLARNMHKRAIIAWIIYALEKTIYVLKKDYLQLRKTIHASKKNYYITHILSTIICTSIEFKKKKKKKKKGGTWYFFWYLRGEMKVFCV